MKILHFSPRFQIFSVFHGCASRRICLFLSPSIRYSILRKTLSIKIVWGHIHPQKILPNTTVKSVMKINPVMAPIVRIKVLRVEWLSENKNSRSKILNLRTGLPFIFRNGKTKRQLAELYLQYFGNWYIFLRFSREYPFPFTGVIHCTYRIPKCFGFYNVSLFKI